MFHFVPILVSCIFQVNYLFYLSCYLLGHTVIHTILLSFFVFIGSLVLDNGNLWFLSLFFDSLAKDINFVDLFKEHNFDFFFIYFSILLISAPVFIISFLPLLLDLLCSSISSFLSEIFVSLILDLLYILIKQFKEECKHCLSCIQQIWIYFYYHSVCNIFTFLL